MPAGDITHPVPDLTGYITEGQVVLSAEAARARASTRRSTRCRSLSRLMRHGAGPGRTRDDHLDVAAQLLAALARARQVARARRARRRRPPSAPPTGSTSRFEDAFTDVLVDQRPDERRSLDETLDRAWQVLSLLPRRELTMLSPEQLDASYAPPGATP